MGPLASLSSDERIEIQKNKNSKGIEICLDDRRDKSGRMMITKVIALGHAVGDLSIFLRRVCGPEQADNALRDALLRGAHRRTVLQDQHRDIALRNSGRGMAHQVMS
jgi:hypothetical protein